MLKKGQYQLVFGNSSNMNILRNGEVDLVLTNPPYFGDATEALLKQPIKQQIEVKRVREEVTSYALGLRPVYDEIRRILKPGGALALQVSDIHYGGVLISLSALHREMAESTGLNLIGRLFRQIHGRRSATRRFLDKPRVGSFRTDEVEEIFILADPDVLSRDNAPVELSSDEIRSCSSPLWTMAPAGQGREHPYQSPKTLVRRMIALYSEPGDLVVDPFAGAGTALAIAVQMGRRAVGYEIEERYAKLADKSIAHSINLSPKR